jgi:RNA polymerase subunit RPABC4/transcription elongation factor Spt4
MMMQQMQKTPLTSMESESCPQCGKGVPADIKFCPYCGLSLEKQPQQKIDIPMINCGSCGKQILRDVNFCPYCGKEVPQGVVLKCKNCGKGIPPDVKYCPHCGSKTT